jgi:DNA-binding transcriptional ArsR family regulator
VLILAIMLMEVLDRLRDAGIEAAIDPPEKTRKSNQPDAILTLEMDGVRRRFVVEVKSRSPYPGEISNTIEQLHQYARWGHPLLVTRYVSPSVGSKLSGARCSWADLSGNFDIRAPQFRARQRLSGTRPKSSGPPIPRGPGALAIIRFLINESSPNQPFGPSELANIGGVSQPRATQVLQRLRDAGLVSGGGRDWLAEKEALLEAFLEQYQGPGGPESLFYSLDPPLEVAQNLVRWAETQRATLAISADVGPDLISPWRRPTHVIAYLREETSPSSLKLVRAKSRDDANVIARTPDDISVFPIHQLAQNISGTEIPCADVTQMIWDLRSLGGTDREEAASNLSQWLLSHH